MADARVFAENDARYGYADLQPKSGNNDNVISTVEVLVREKITKDLFKSLKIVDPKKFKTPNYSLGNRSCIMVAETDTSKAYGIRLGDVVFGIGCYCLNAKKLVWFDFRPLDFVEGAALLKAVLLAPRFSYYVLKIYRGMWPERLGMNPSTDNTNNTNNANNINNTKRKSVATTAPLKKSRIKNDANLTNSEASSVTESKAAVEAKPSVTSEKVAEKEKEKPKEIKPFPLVERVQKFFTVSWTTNHQSIGISLAVIGDLVNNADPDSLPLWLPKQFTGLNLPFVTAIYDTSFAHVQVKPGDILIGVDDKSFKNMNISQVRSALSNALKHEKGCLKFGRMYSDGRKSDEFELSHIETERFNRSLLNGGSGYCIRGSPLPKLSDESRVLKNITCRISTNSATRISMPTSPRSPKKTGIKRTLSITGTPKGAKQDHLQPHRFLYSLTTQKEKHEIRVGKEYQAEIPEFISPDKGEFWQPSKLPDKYGMSAYIEYAQTHQYPLELALKLLSESGYNLQASRSLIKELNKHEQYKKCKYVGNNYDSFSSLQAACSKPLKLASEWTPAAVEAFNASMYKVCGRDFQLIRFEMSCLGFDLSMHSIVNYYYSHWKHSNAYDAWSVFRKYRVRSPTEFHNDICEVCNEDGNVDDGLLCETCNLVFHTHCLSPPLEEIPKEDWFCPVCIKFFGKYRNGEALMAAAKSYIRSQEISYSS